MKSSRVARLSILTALALPHVAQAFKPFSAQTVGFPERYRPMLDAIGTLEVFPFRNKKESLACTAFHIGHGYVVTAGHCFLGATQCNGAYVRFGVWKGRPEAETRTSRCQKVVSTSADDSRLEGNHDDYAIFKVTNPPTAALTVDLNRRPSLNTRLLTVSYPRPHKRLADTFFWSQDCKVTSTLLSSVVGMPMPDSNFAHDCGALGGSSGAPIFNFDAATVVGLQQSSFFVEPHRTTRTQDSVKLPRSNIAKFIASTTLASKITLLLNRQDEGTVPQNIVVGNFAAEAFPGALPGGISLHVAKIGVGASTVSFKYRNGIATSLFIIDGQGRRTTFSGTPLYNARQRVSFTAPIDVYAMTGDDGHALRASLDEIQVQ